MEEDFDIFLGSFRPHSRIYLIGIHFPRFNTFFSLSSYLWFLFTTWLSWEMRIMCVCLHILLISDLN